VNIALPSIGRDLDIDNANLTWVVAAYSYFGFLDAVLTLVSRMDAFC
jgi:hypothetical protein